jgi:hypothetical protein
MASGSETNMATSASELHTCTSQPIVHHPSTPKHMPSNLAVRYQVCALAVIALTGCATTRNVHARAASSRVAADTPLMVVDSLARRWATLEIARAHTRTIWERWAPESRAADDQIAAIQEQVIAASSDARSPRRALQYVLESLDARQVALAATHRELIVTYLSSSPTVVALSTEARLVEQRRNELRVSLATVSQVSTRR